MSYEGSVPSGSHGATVDAVATLALPATPHLTVNGEANKAQCERVFRAAVVWFNGRIGHLGPTFTPILTVTLGESVVCDGSGPICYDPNTYTLYLDHWGPDSAGYVALATIEAAKAQFITEAERNQAAQQIVNQDSLQYFDVPKEKQ